MSMMADDMHIVLAAIVVLGSLGIIFSLRERLARRKSESAEGMAAFAALEKLVSRLVHEALSKSSEFSHRP